MNSVLVFDLNGTRIGDLTPKPLATPRALSGLALKDGKLYALDMASNQITVIEK
jgi:hypothetical protein